MKLSIRINTGCHDHPLQLEVSMKYGQKEKGSGELTGGVCGSRPRCGCGRQNTGILALILLLTATGCHTEVPGFSAEDESRGKISIMTWNVQALFDGTETGNEYDEYRGTAWNREKYAARLNSLAQALDNLDVVPDILALEEVENAGVLKDLADRMLSDRGYRWTFFANNPGNSLGLGVLSRFPFAKKAAHSLGYQDGTIPRPVLELWVEIEGTPLALFVCHWKSKLGGEDSTGKMRQGAAQIILRRTREIGETHPSIPVLIAGDLNENHNEFYRRGGTGPIALVPDDPGAAEAMKSDGTEAPPAGFLILSKQRPPVPKFFPPDSIGFYSPWMEVLREGSYWYQNEWETIDHFLLSSGLFDGSGWEFDECEVVNTPPFTNSRGYPNVYNPRTGAGLSDHLPLMLSLRFTGSGTAGE
jgi:endonuclease/exonuclease/phosphatase family metal-dependent hydrolase